MARIVIEVSDRTKHLVLALEQFAELITKLEHRGSGGKAIDYANIEREVGAAAAAIEREAHRTLLDLPAFSGPAVPWNLPSRRLIVRARLLA